ncbi:radical SAM protein [Melioribacter sp. OK-6-Me]|uniref:radical SAM protein n=1 Tax=unclassified Melioribacter TaxID=2627329 RepID=UPI003EDB62BC
MGINNIPPKVCSYSCIYCQLGSTNTMSISRKEYYSTNHIYDEAAERITQLQKAGEQIDYLTFVPDGEPTLDINLGKTVDRLKSFGIKIAVITNSSLMNDEEVRRDLMKADWVSVKIDSGYENIWRKVNRPHGLLDLHEILHGIELFAYTYKGVLVTETMLVKGVNDSIESLSKTAQIISEINPHKSYILVPTRPPAEKLVNIPTEESLNAAYQIFSCLLNNVELIVHNEGTDFSYSSDAEKELMNILAVHPMRKDAVEKFLSKANSNWEMINSMLRNNLIKFVEYNNDLYYIKNIHSREMNEK